MLISLDCFPCLLSQSLRAARLSTSDPLQIKEVLDQTCRLMEGLTLDLSPPEAGQMVYERVNQLTGNQDPYKESKITWTERAKSLYPDLKKKVRRSDDPLLSAAMMAIAGNVIDFGVGNKFNGFQQLLDILKRKPVINDFPIFKERLSQVDSVLYIADNAGESVFDRLLIEEMDVPVTYAVRESPIINDVTHEDAVLAGLDQIARIISSGNRTPGTILKLSNREFREHFNRSRLIISKGQGNYEGLSDTEAPVFFLLMVKCEVVARHIGAANGSLVLKAVNIQTM